MPFFQAYCFDKDYDGNSFVLTFPDYTVADEWWRAISDTPDIVLLFTRVNPQFYTHTASILNVSDFFTDSRTKDIAPKLLGRVYMKKIDDRNGGFPILQNLDVTNVFIRTITKPHLYWYYADQSDDAGKPITVSETSRTRFLITATTCDKGKVLLDKDWVNLQIENTKRPLYVVHKDIQVPGQKIYALRSADIKSYASMSMKYVRNDTFALPDRSLALNSAHNSSDKQLIWEFVQ